MTYKILLPFLIIISCIALLISGLFIIDKGEKQKHKGCKTLLFGIGIVLCLLSVGTLPLTYYLKTYFVLEENRYLILAVNDQTYDNEYISLTISDGTGATADIEIHVTDFTKNEDGNFLVVREYLFDKEYDIEYVPNGELSSFFQSYQLAQSF